MNKEEAEKQINNLRKQNKSLGENILECHRHIHNNKNDIISLKLKHNIPLEAKDYSIF